MGRGSEKGGWREGGKVYDLGVGCGIYHGHMNEDWVDYEVMKLDVRYGKSQNCIIRLGLYWGWRPGEFLLTL
jgi:hypothetical protein